MRVVQSDCSTGWLVVSTSGKALSPVYRRRESADIELQAFETCGACGLDHDPRCYCHECGGIIRPVASLDECVPLSEITNEEN